MTHGRSYGSDRRLAKGLPSQGRSAANSVGLGRFGRGNLLYANLAQTDAVSHPSDQVLSVRV